MLEALRTAGTPVIRTYFTDERAWECVLAEMTAPQGDFIANISPVDDFRFEGLVPEQAGTLAAAAGHAMCLLVDAEAVTRPDHAFLVVEAVAANARMFRCVPEQAWSVENNLSLANMDFEDFMGASDETGTFRGFV